MPTTTRYFHDKLRDSRWLEKRIAILKRDKHRCCYCGLADITGSLQVRFIVRMDCDPWELPDHYYQTVCRACLELRQPILDDGLNAIRIAVSSISTDRLGRLLDQLINRAQHEALQEGRD